MSAIADDIVALVHADIAVRTDDLATRLDWSIRDTERLCWRLYREQALDNCRGYWCISTAHSSQGASATDGIGNNEGRTRA